MSYAAVGSAMDDVIAEAVAKQQALAKAAQDCAARGTFWLPAPLNQCADDKLRAKQACLASGSVWLPEPFNQCADPKLQAKRDCVTGGGVWLDPPFDQCAPVVPVEHAPAPRRSVISARSGLVTSSVMPEARLPVMAPLPTPVRTQTAVQAPAVRHVAAVREASPGKRPSYTAMWIVGGLLVAGAGAYFYMESKKKTAARHP